MKHWINFLPEVGYIKRFGDEQTDILNKIKSLENDIKYLKEEYDKNEDNILKSVKSDWTDNEISDAKLKAKKQ